jgi:hypothetical protein
LQDIQSSNGSQVTYIICDSGGAVGYLVGQADVPVDRGINGLPKPISTQDLEFNLHPVIDDASVSQPLQQPKIEREMRAETPIPVAVPHQNPGPKILPKLDPMEQQPDGSIFNSIHSRHASGSSCGVVPGLAGDVLRLPAAGLGANRGKRNAAGLVLTEDEFARLTWAYG